MTTICLAVKVCGKFLTKTENNQMLRTVYRMNFKGKFKNYDYKLYCMPYKTIPLCDRASHAILYNTSSFVQFFVLLTPYKLRI